jgi:hypothetical protein
VAAHRTDSERFDLALLKRIREFSSALDRNYDRFSLAGHRFTEQEPAVVDQKTLENARLLESETPLPQKVRISGVLDMIRRSSQGFELVLDDGMKVRGVLVGGDMDSLKPLFGRRVLVLGTAVYRPSGSPLRIDADLVEPSEADSSLWASFPPPRRRKLDTKLLLKPQSAKTGVSAFYGTWPGVETDEEWNELRSV